MTVGRFRKRLSRSLMLTWRERPTRHDIEALQANIARVGLVVRVRWMLIIVLVVYSVVGGLLYMNSISLAELFSLMWLPAVALLFVVFYNLFYALNYRRLGNIAVWNSLQLFLDALVVTVLVYFSGGTHSWFWAMYALFILEAAFILPQSRDVWLHAFVCMALLGGIQLAEFMQLLPHQEIPFSETPLHLNTTFVLVRYMWQVTVLSGTAGVATLLVGEYRREIAARSQSILDASTGLFTWGYLHRSLEAELRRALRSDRSVHVFLIDIDGFGEFNSRFGFDAGDGLLRKIASTILDTVSPDSVTGIGNIVARIGGEEFAVLYAEDAETEAPPSPEDAIALAERVRYEVEKLTIGGAGATVSIGIATSMRDATSAQELLDAADKALGCAAAEGGNRVRSLDQCAEPIAASGFSPRLDV